MEKSILCSRSIMVCLLARYFRASYQQVLEPKGLEHIFCCLKVHILATNNMQNKKAKFRCEACDYECSRKFLWEQHCATRKHISQQSATLRNKKYALFSCACGKGYKSRSGLWRHQKQCALVCGTVDSQIPAKDTAKTNSTLNHILETLDRHKVEREELVGQLAAQSELIRKMVPHMGDTNTQVNVNIFLDTHCQNALNMSDFIRTLPVHQRDLEYTSKNGLPEGICSMMVQGLARLNLAQRPIHCTDVKREVLYVRENDEWAKGPESTQRLTDAITAAANKQRTAIASWVRDNPEWMSSEEGRERYLKLVEQVMGDTDERSTVSHIIKGVAKASKLENDDMALSQELVAGNCHAQENKHHGNVVV